MDLFAGCGGISAGAHLAGCEIIGAVELDPLAAQSHAINFHPHDSEEVIRWLGSPRDISCVEPQEYIGQIRSDCKDPLREVDILVGGPPCQAFARVGRAKLREVMEHSEAFLHDSRSGLYRHYIKFVESLAPVAVLIENVPDVLNYGGLNIFETIAGVLEDLGYECRYSLLNASHYGVPQMRTRSFLVAVAKCAEIEPGMPHATHHHVLPVGYRGTKDVALRHISIFERSHYIETVSQPGLTPAVTAEEAIGDLPPITGHLEGKLKKAACRLDQRIRLPSHTHVSDYGRIMRNWPGFRSDGYVCDHVIRCLPRDYKIFKAMKPGDQYPEAHAIAREMFRQALLRVERDRGSRLSESSSEYRELLASYVPPYDPGKFPNKWRKMEADEPARTLTAHIGKDTYSHIHYDSNQARTISVREAARLQSFPDGFRFAGTMNSAFRQIGNAVPPLLAFAVLSRMIHDLGGRSLNPLVDILAHNSDSPEPIHEPIASGY